VLDVLLITIGSGAFAAKAQLLHGSGRPSLGASRTVIALLTAAAVLAPCASIGYGIGMSFIPIPIAWVAVEYLLQDVRELGSDSRIGHATHLGGAVFGIVYDVAKRVLV